MAMHAAVVSESRQSLLGILLGATLPLTSHGRPALRPLWANEAMHRAYNMIRLTAGLEHHAPLCQAGPDAAQGERRVATELAAIFRSLDDDDDDAVVSCSQVLRFAVHDLIELFAPVAGRVLFRTSLEQVSLPAFRRRALVLAACEMVVDGLCRGHSQSDPVEITVALHSTGCTQMRLAIAAGEVGRLRDRCYRPSDILSDLAALLTCDGSLGCLQTSSPVVELTFPTGRADAVRGRGDRI